MSSNQTTRPAKIGLLLPGMEKNIGMSRWAEIRDMALQAEDMGFDSVWVVDHFLYKLENDQPPNGAWECWSLVSALAACTTKVEIGTLVLGMGFRNPALLAKMADTVDEISGGRLILGVGAGYHKYEYDAFGYPFDYKFSRFEEGIQILHSLLKTGKVDFEGRFHSARECELKPRGPSPEGPPIMVGGRGPKMLRAVARYADIWNGFWDDVANSPEGFAAVSARIDEACDEVGRDPATLARSATVLVADPSAEPWWEDMPFDNDADLGALKPLFGAPEEIAESFHGFVAEGVSSLQIHLDPMTPEAVERLAPVLEAFDAG